MANYCQSLANSALDKRFLKQQSQFMRYKLSFLSIFASILFAGCAYYNNYVHQFFADCQASVPAIRIYAIEHLQNLSEKDKSVIDTTEPKIAAANWVAVHFTWPNICMVDSSAPMNDSNAPAKCEPLKVVDLRLEK